ncbi:MAG: alpha/beta fold hydrolase [Actinobacteria bacterium]|nr:alpha/beta fold hydrolase [Actinomycetota bacterium]
MPTLTIPDGRNIDLPRRGATWIRTADGPKGAPTVILLHGLGATGLLNWFPAFGPLAREYNVVAIDHRGHGRGIKPRRPFRLADCADDVAVLIDELGIGNAILVGYSMGGPITQLSWHRHPEVVRGVVLCATSCRFGRADQRLAPVGTAMGVGLRFTPRLVRQQMVRGMVGFNPRARRGPDWVSEELRGHDPAAVIEAAMSIGRFDSTPWIEEIDVPAASVITDYDRLVPPRRQQRLAELTRGEVFHVRGGHDACVSQPGLFVPALLSAVRSVAARSSA